MNGLWVKTSFVSNRYDYELNKAEILSLTKTIEELARSILNICTSRADFIPWQTVKRKKFDRSVADDDDDDCPVAKRSYVTI